MRRRSLLGSYISQDLLRYIGGMGVAVHLPRREECDGSDRKVRLVQGQYTAAVLGWWVEDRDFEELLAFCA